MTSHSGVESVLMQVAEPTHFSGVASRGVLVRCGGRFHSSGVVSGPLTVEAGGSAFVSGVLSGPVSIAEDASLEVSGVVTGAIIRNDGKFFAAVGAVIHGKQLSDSGVFVDPASGPVMMTSKSARFLLTGTGTHLAAVSER